MREAFGPPLKAAALSAFIAGVVLLLVNPPSLSGLWGMVALVVGAIAIILLTAWATVALIGGEMPDPSFGGWSIEARHSRKCRPPTARRASSTNS